MASPDSAFLWETEALRSSRPAPTPGEGHDWITLREAHDETGISVPTLRRWARKDLIPSYLEPSRDGQLRMVSRSAVARRAADLGRGDEAGRAERPLEPTATSTTAVERPPAPPEEPGSPPPGTMLVPIDAWDKMLMQLGNLHQAGQELAEARERAAKAETEVRFLKERLAERRAAETAPAEQPQPEHQQPPRPEGAAAAAPSPDQRTKTPGFTRLMWRAWRTRPKD